MRLILLALLLPLPALAEVRVDFTGPSCFKGIEQMPSGVVTEIPDLIEAGSEPPGLSFPPVAVSGDRGPSLGFGLPAIAPDAFGLTLPPGGGTLTPVEDVTSPPPSGPSRPSVTLRQGPETWSGYDLGEFGGRLRLEEGNDVALDLMLPFPVTGLVADPAEATCLMVSMGLRHLWRRSGGVFRLCPSRGWDLIRVPQVRDLQNDEGGEGVPILSMTSGPEGVVAVGDIGTWTLKDGRWSFAPRQP